MIPIDHGIPIPPKAQRIAQKYPWTHMKVGDSIRVPGRGSAARHSACQFGKVSRRKFCCRLIDSYTRIWRIA